MAQSGRKFAITGVDSVIWEKGRSFGLRQTQDADTNVTQAAANIMSQGDALLASILDAPAEDTPRLVYADWLEENDQPGRAEFIRVQIEVARIDWLNFRHVRSGKALGLLTREKSLLESSRLDWLSPLRRKNEPLECSSTHGVFRRGFVEIVWMPAARFLSHAERLFQLCPASELRVTRTTFAEIDQLLSSPLLTKLDTLDLADVKLGQTVPALVSRSRFARSLRSLRLRGCGITDEGARQLSAVPFDWPLEELDVAYNPIGPMGLAALHDRFGSAVRKTF